MTPAAARATPDAARSTPDQPTPALRARALLPAIRAAADDPGAADHGPARAMALLRDAGLLVAALPEAAGGEGVGTSPHTAHDTATLLRRLGRADLSAARLFEGHVNAIKLIALHGGDEVRGRAFDLVRAGGLLGVWGADDGAPVRLESNETGDGGGDKGGDGDKAGDGRSDAWGRLAGAKRYASGLGLVDAAIVTVTAPDGPRMVLVDARDTDRQRPERWTATAMRATRSGVHDLTGIEVAAADLIGPPGALSTEPWFEGGIWRYAAAHVGGAEALVQATLDLLAASGRAGDPHQAARLGRALALTDSARRMVEACAVLVETTDPADPAATDRAVSHALLTRALVEDACVEVLALAERALGMIAHDAAAPVDRIRRDLSLYLRQAAPDGKLMRAVATLVDARAEVGETW